MSLEKKIEELTEAVQNLTECLINKKAGTIVKGLDSQIPQQTEDIEKMGAKFVEVQRQTEVEAIKKEKEADPEPEKDDGKGLWDAMEVGEITAEVLREKVVDLANAKGREAPRELLKSFGVAKIVDLDKDKYAEVYRAAEAKLQEADK